jgi:hypothetical protein
MEKKEVANIISEILSPIGFKKKGNYWLINGDVITKMVNLQKSEFENSFYINYGYIIKSIPLDNLMMHVFQRVGSLDDNESTRIKELLNLENNISNEERAKQLKQLIIDKVVLDIQKVNTERDLLNELKTRPHLNNIPLVVKKHFHIA